MRWTVGAFAAVVLVIACSGGKQQQQAKAQTANVGTGGVPCNSGNTEAKPYTPTCAATPTPSPTPTPGGAPSARVKTYSYIDQFGIATDVSNANAQIIYDNGEGSGISGSVTPATICNGNCHLGFYLNLPEQDVFFDKFTGDGFWQGGFTNQGALTCPAGAKAYPAGPTLLDTGNANFGTTSTTPDGVPNYGDETWYRHAAGTSATAANRLVSDYHNAPGTGQYLWYMNPGSLTLRKWSAALITHCIFAHGENLDTQYYNIRYDQMNGPMSAGSSDFALQTYTGSASIGQTTSPWFSGDKSKCGGSTLFPSTTDSTAVTAINTPTTLTVASVAGMAVGKRMSIESAKSTSNYEEVAITAVTGTTSGTVTATFGKTHASGVSIYTPCQQLTGRLTATTTSTLEDANDTQYYSDYTGFWDNMKHSDGSQMPTIYNGTYNTDVVKNLLEHGANIVGTLSENHVWSAGSGFWQGATYQAAPLDVGSYIAANDPSKLFINMNDDVSDAIGSAAFERGLKLAHGVDWLIMYASLEAFDYFSGTGASFHLNVFPISYVYPTGPLTTAAAASGPAGASCGFGMPQACTVGGAEDSAICVYKQAVSYSHGKCLFRREFSDCYVQTNYLTLATGVDEGPCSVIENATDNDITGVTMLCSGVNVSHVCTTGGTPYLTQNASYTGMLETCTPGAGATYDVPNCTPTSSGGDVGGSSVGFHGSGPGTVNCSIAPAAVTTWKSGYAYFYFGKNTASCT